MYDICYELDPIIKIIKAVIDAIRIGIPIILIILGMVDLGKAVIAGKEDDQKKAQSLLIKRCIYAVAIFVLVNVMLLVFRIVDSNTEDDGSNWFSCLEQSFE